MKYFYQTNDDPIEFETLENIKKYICLDLSNNPVHRTKIAKNEEGNMQVFVEGWYWSKGDLIEIDWDEKEDGKFYINKLTANGKVIEIYDDCFLKENYYFARINFKDSDMEDKPDPEYDLVEKVSKVNTLVDSILKHRYQSDVTISKLKKELFLWEEEYHDELFPDNELNSKVSDETLFVILFEAMTIIEEICYPSEFSNEEFRKSKFYKPLIRIPVLECIKKSYS